MKVLIIRFSSIGDIVLTTPVIRAIKTQLPLSTVHYLTKKKFADILDNNPYIDQLHVLDQSLSDVISVLKKEKYDVIIDLHHNARTFLIKKRLCVKSYSFPKLNLQKWLLVNLKRNAMPPLHVVDRYFETVKKIGIINDEQPCDYFISKENEVDIYEKYHLQTGSYISIAIGAQFATKRMPLEKLTEIIDKINLPILLVGGPDDQNTGNSLINQFPDKKIFNACGQHTLGQSADLVRKSAVLLTNDTGMMHIAACFQIPIVSVWGNTVPALGMYPYFPGEKNTAKTYSIHEVEKLNCRPCSKIGYSKCPKGHFRCMREQNIAAIVADIVEFANIKSEK